MENLRKIEIVSKIKKLKIKKSECINFILDVMETINIYGEISLIFCSKSKIREINKKYRQKDSATDVITFPYSNAGNFIGEIIICQEVAEENSKKYGVPLEKEIKKLLVHSILHLLGYDHHNDKGKMARKEKIILKSLGELP
ncbi:MAG: rRNA maturation RNase YbeY [Acidobacteria bacterium]|nr:rRNA maturation RNase YbeY [Acidobacteriota bacterium]